MDKLSHLIPKVLQKRGLKEQANASYAIHLANEWIQENHPELAPFTKATLLSGGVLSIEGREIEMISQPLLQYLNRFEGITVAEIRILR